MLNRISTWRDELYEYLSESQLAIWEHLRTYQAQVPVGHCPLPELFRDVAEPLDLSIGQFHDCLRMLAAEKQIRLHAFAGAAFQYRDEQYGLMLGQELKFYAEPLVGPFA